MYSAIDNALIMMIQRYRNVSNAKNVDKQGMLAMPGMCTNV